ncbi:hypothetical protein D3C76_1735130 [compost metagenome]
MQQTLGDAGDAVLIQGEPIQQRFRRTVLPAALQIFAVGRNDRLAVLDQRFCCREQGFVLFIRGQTA